MQQFVVVRMVGRAVAFIVGRQGKTKMTRKKYKSMVFVSFLLFISQNSPASQP
jgi:hypothetical protein